MNPEREGDVLEHAQIREQCPALEQHAHLFAEAVEGPTFELRDLMTIHHNTAGVRLELTTNEAQQCGFTGSAGPHDRGNLSARNVQADTVEDTAPGAGEHDILERYVSRRIHSPYLSKRGYIMPRSVQAQSKQPKMY